MGPALHGGEAAVAVARAALRRHGDGLLPLLPPSMRLTKVAAANGPVCVQIDRPSRGRVPDRRRAPDDSSSPTSSSARCPRRPTSSPRRWVSVTRPRLAPCPVSDVDPPSADEIAAIRRAVRLGRVAVSRGDRTARRGQGQLRRGGVHATGSPGVRPDLNLLVVGPHDERLDAGRRRDRDRLPPRGREAGCRSPAPTSSSSPRTWRACRSCCWRGGCCGARRW